MTAPRGRAAFGEQIVDQLLTQVLAEVGEDTNDDLVRRMLVASLDMDADEVDRLELKIASQTMVEMHNAWRVFSPYRERPKVTVFGSARTSAEHPDYQLAVETTRQLSERQWMIISGAGPGIMTAAIEGAGIENSLGVNIVLPFETRAADIIEGDPKLATFRYFFTRKLFFMKESDGFLLLPGGFGTLDEAFELLTLIQTGKSYPAPIVLLDHPGSSYWQRFLDLVSEALIAEGMAVEADLGLVFHTHDPAEATDAICRFYSTFHSLRSVGQRTVLRLSRPVTDETLSVLNAEFGDIVVDGDIAAIEATDAERRDDDHVDLPRLAFTFDQKSFARLHRLIQRLNELESPADISDSVVQAPVHDLEPVLDDEAV